jgi:hypothetical protein
MEEPELERPPHAGAPQVGGVPTYLVGKAMRSTRSLVWRTLKRDGSAAFEYELWLCFFAGIVRQRWADRHLPIAAGPASAVPRAERVVQTRAALG